VIATSYYSIEVFGENVQNKEGGKESGIIQSVTVRADDLSKNKFITLGQFLKKEDGNEE
jgi:hypothetical protein